MTRRQKRRRVHPRIEQMRQDGASKAEIKAASKAEKDRLAALLKKTPEQLDATRQLQRQAAASRQRTVSRSNERRNAINDQ